MSKEKAKESNEIVKAAPVGLAAYTQASEGQFPAEFAAVTAPTMIPYLSLAQGQMDEILSGQAVPGEYLLGQDSINLGKAPDFWVAAWRSKAIHTVNKEAVSESYDVESEEFREIVRESRMAEKVEGVQRGYGPEFLLRHPRYGWATYHFKGTAQQRGRDAYARLGNGIRMTSETKKSAKYTWLVPVVTACELPAPEAKEVEAAREVFLSVTPAAKAPPF